MKQQNEETTVLWGWILLVGALGFFTMNFYTMVISKLFPDMGIPFIDYIKHDEYYCLLIPSSIIATWIFVYVNWFAFKFFRHN
jgi:hypothetical protein